MSADTITQPMVRAEQVHKSFGRLEVLKGIDLEVAPRKVFVIIGPSGSGKSTFLRCINHLEKINSGRLSVDGELVGYIERGGKLHELGEKQIARQRQDVGMVFQRFNLFPHLTAIENVMEAPLRVKKESKVVVPRAGTEAAGPRGTWRPYDLLPGPALRRSAAARCDRPRAGDGTQADAL